jgi:hypothetical protein
MPANYFDACDLNHHRYDMQGQLIAAAHPTPMAYGYENTIPSETSL